MGGANPTRSRAFCAAGGPPERRNVATLGLPPSVVGTSACLRTTLFSNRPSESMVLRCGRVYAPCEPNHPHYLNPPTALYLLRRGVEAATGAFYLVAAPARWSGERRRPFRSTRRTTAYRGAAATGKRNGAANLFDTFF